MSIFTDVLPIFKKHILYFEEKRIEVGDVVTFVFKPKQSINWKAGQHGVFFIDHIKINKPSRAFSVASSPNEDKVIISMRITESPSEFKKAFMDLKPGDTISMRGPIGGLYIKNSMPVLMIAGGVGVTPYRSILKSYIDMKELKPKHLTLVYIDSKEEFLYKEELNNLSNADGINIKLISNREEATNVIQSYVKQYGNESNYFISGSKEMVKSIKQLLKNESIKGKNIKSDVFIGY